MELIWAALGIILAAGAVGGIVNALLTDNGFILPRPKATDGDTIWLPGILGNLVLGGIGAAVSWGLYGPASTYVLLNSSGSSAAAQAVILTLSALVGGVLVGAAGARWWSSEVDKKLLKTATGKAAAANAAPGVVAKIMAASPQAAFDIASALP